MAQRIDPGGGNVLIGKQIPVGIEQAGLIGGEKVRRIGFEGAELQEVDSFQDVHWYLTRGALEGQNVRLVFDATAGHTAGDVLLTLSQMDASEANADLFKKIGILGPFTRPMIGEVMVGDVAEKAGLQQGDVVLQVGAVRVVDGQQLRQLIRSSVSKTQSAPIVWKINRAGVDLDIVVKPEVRQDGELLVGKIGAYVGALPELVMVSYGPFDGLWRGMSHTWDVSMLTLKMMGKMLVGEASLKNLSGPLTIADYAGKSAGMGMTQYLLCLALISVSLGVLNLLPLPVLDGGHLMYYLWEGLTGKPVSDAVMEHLQRGGIAVLLVMMSIAFFNDITRLFS